MIKQKFQPGDKVKVVGYGHPLWTTKEEHAKMFAAGWTSAPQPKNILHETDTHYTYDMQPTIVGKTGIVKGSYADLSESNSWGTPRDERTSNTYSVDGIPEKAAWYDEEQLE